MPYSVLPASFFEAPALRVARGLLGKFLVTREGGRERAAFITEVEAYTGPHDKACHAWQGRTKRNEPMYGPPGHWYVYLCYGMHRMLNIVTGEEGYPAAVLIRGVESAMGPGRLSKQLGIDARYNSLPATRRSGLWIEDRGKVIPHDSIVRTQRIGVDYAGVWATKPYRFLITDRD
jgi:DNA-3-methyladenine glycosylase